MSFPTMSGVIVQSSNIPQNKPLVLSEGQLFHGQIKQLFPGQMAEVQIGGQKLIAKLEIPLKAGDSYYFQVHAIKPELQLKIISGPLALSEGQTQQLQSLMSAMQLPKTSEMQELLAFFIKNKIPISREGLLQAETMLKSTQPINRNEALTSIQKLVELKIPFNESNFRSLFGVESKEGLHTVISTLRSVLTADSSISPIRKENIISALDNMAKPFVQGTTSALLGHAFTTLLNNKETTPENRFAALQMLTSTGVLPKQTSLANLNQMLSTLLESSSSKPATSSSTPQQQVAVSTIQTSTQAAQQALNAVMQLANNMIASPFQLSAKEQLISMLGNQSPTEIVDNLTAFVRNAEKSTNPVIQRMLQSAETTVTLTVDGKAIQDALQTVIRSLGLNYEAGLLNKENIIGKLAETLKPQLLALMQDPSVTQSVRESAEAVVVRLNGPLLLSGETGAQHQLIMQVPLEFFGKRIDTTLQWNGRLKEDGKIDPDFARILFYLDLHNLNKTIIDMHVQNKVVSITVYNAENNLKGIGAQFQSMLNEGLEAKGYQLSGIYFKTFSEEEKKAQSVMKKERTEERGVDIRI